MNKCFLGLGSNQKEPLRQLRRALCALKNLPRSQLLKVSSFYWNKAWGRQNQPDFCNLVVMLLTSLTPEELLTRCQAIEKQQGRLRKQPWGPRTLDIDILLYGNLDIQTTRLTIPHPQVFVRDFTRIPLEELI